MTAATEIGESDAGYSVPAVEGQSRAVAISQGQDYADSFIVPTPDRTKDVADEVADTHAYTEIFEAESIDKAADTVGTATATQDHADSTIAPTPERFRLRKDTAEEVAETQDYADSFIVPSPERGKEVAEEVAETQAYTDSFAAESAEKEYDVVGVVTETQDYADSFAASSPEQKRVVQDVPDEVAETKGYTDSFASESAENFRDAIVPAVETQDYADSFVIPTPDRSKETKDVTENVAETQAYTDSFAAESPSKVHDAIGTAADTQDYADSFIIPTPERAKDLVDTVEDVEEEISYSQEQAHSSDVYVPALAKNRDVADDDAAMRAYMDSFEEVGSARGAAEGGRPPSHAYSDSFISPYDDTADKPDVVAALGADGASTPALSSRKADRDDQDGLSRGSGGAGGGEESEAVYSDSFVETEAEGDNSGGSGESVERITSGISKETESVAAVEPGTAAASELLIHSTAPADAQATELLDIDEDIMEEDLPEEEDLSGAMENPAAEPVRIGDPAKSDKVDVVHQQPTTDLNPSAASMSGSPDEAEETFCESDIEAAAAAASGFALRIDPQESLPTVLGGADDENTFSSSAQDTTLSAIMKEAPCPEPPEGKVPPNSTDAAAASRQEAARLVRSAADALLMELLGAAILDEGALGPMQKTATDDLLPIPLEIPSTTSSHDAPSDTRMLTTSCAEADILPPVAAEAVPGARNADAMPTKRLAEPAATAAAAERERAEAREYLETLAEQLPDGVWTGELPFDELAFVEFEREVHGQVICKRQLGNQKWNEVKAKRLKW